MVSKKSAINASITALLFFAGVKFFSLVKASFIVGSWTGYFSGANMLLSLSGAFGGLFGASVLFGLRAIFRFITFGSLPLRHLAFVVPGWCASIAWTTKHWVLHIVLPLFCMFLFVVHPVGSVVWIYSLYWLIPVALFIIPRKNLFTQALSSTFIAHAVGSVIWIYSVPMMAAQWIALIPIVAAERLTFAMGMVVLHKAISCAIELYCEYKSTVFTFIKIRVLPTS